MGNVWLGFVTLLVLCTAVRSTVGGLTDVADLPTLYEYYTEGGVTSGVEPLADGFRLNNKTITILSGAIHYFRVHPAYWRDRLRKLRALGANTVETYVPWNLHEPSPGKFDFGQGQDDMSPFLDIVNYIRIAQEEDLLVIVRPGPYICAEWEFGGMPSWLLRDREMRVRTSDPRFEERVRIYFGALLPLLVDLQFTNGGPIIAFQVENEYGGAQVGVPIATGKARQYLINLHQMMQSLGLKEMFLTSDSPSLAEAGSIPSEDCGTYQVFDVEKHPRNIHGNVLRTANFKTLPEVQLHIMQLQQPDKPLMVMEYWTGWFDHWLEKNHHVTPLEDYVDVLERILKYPSSVNMYMYHGGTSWGFMNGANMYHSVFPYYEADVTSYDYGAPLSEGGDYTDKYFATKQLYEKYNPVKTRQPEIPDLVEKVAYPSAPVTGQLVWEDIIGQVAASERAQSRDVISMEMLDMNEGAGQSYGYIVYRNKEVTIGESSVLKITGRVHDIATVLVDGEVKTEPLSDLEQLRGFGYWIQSDAELGIESESAGASRTLDIMVENFGRNNFGRVTGESRDFDERKGLWEGPVLLDGVTLQDWEVVTLQFKGDWVRSLTGWTGVNASSAPSLYQASFSVSEPRDTFLDMRAWGKGVVFVNGFNLGRYFNMGPLRTLYLPAPLLNTGVNQIVVFEQFSAAQQVVFSSTPIYGDIA